MVVNCIGPLGDSTILSYSIKHKSRSHYEHICYATKVHIQCTSNKGVTLDNVSGPDSISWRAISADWGFPEKSTFCLLPSMFQSSSLPFLTTSSMYLDSLNQPHNHVHPHFAIHLWVYLRMILVLWLNIAWYRNKNIKEKENISLYFNENSLINVQL